MKKILIFILLLLPALAIAQGQSTPVNPVQVTQTTLYNEPSTGTRWWYNGATLGWYPLFPYTPPNTVLTGLTLTVVSSTLTVHTGTWRINNQVYTLGTNTNFTLQARDSVYSRYETVYATGVNNGIGIKVGVLSPTPIQPSFGPDTLTVGSVLITPTSTVIIPPGPANEFVFSIPLVQQSYANPWVRTLRSDTIKVGGHYILPPIDGTSGQVIQTDGAGNLFWSNQAIYLPTYPVTLTGQNFGVDTTGSTGGVVTHTALLDTLRNNAAHFNPKQFIIGNDTINLNPTDTTTVDSVLGMKNGRLYKGLGGGGGSGLTDANSGLTNNAGVAQLGGNLITDADIEVGANNYIVSSLSPGVGTANFNITDGFLQQSFQRPTSGGNVVNIRMEEVSSDASMFLGWTNGVTTASKSLTFTGAAVSGITVRDASTHVGLNGNVVFPKSLGTQYAQYFKVDSIAKAKADSVKGTITPGTGTVTNIATSTGITGGPITTTGTLKADTTVLQTVLNFFPKGDTRYARTGSTGTVTSIATSSATGILGGTITSTGTISADTSVLRTVSNSRTLAQTQTALNTKQATLVSGTNIKTINSTSLLGSGDIAISASPGGSTTQVQFNDAGSFGGNSKFLFDKATTNGSAYHNVTITNPYAGGGTVVIFADSYGVGSVTTDTLHAWPYLFAQGMGYAIRNFSQSGSVLESRSPSLPLGGYSMLASETNIPAYGGGSVYKLLIIALGINDWQYGGANYTSANYTADYNTIITYATGTRGWPVGKILIVAPSFVDPALYGTAGAGAGIRTASGLQAFITAANGVATSNGTLYFNPYDWIANKGGVSNLGNTLHPNNSGHALYAQGLLNLFLTQAYQNSQTLATNGTTEIQNLRVNNHAIGDTTYNYILGRNLTGDVAALSKLPYNYLNNAPNVYMSSTGVAVGGSNLANIILNANNNIGSGFDFSPTFVIGGLSKGVINTQGTSYTNGTYTSVPLIGGTGTGGQATIVVSGTIVTSVTITTAGTGYTMGDLLTCANSSVGGTGTGFNWYATTGTLTGTLTAGIRVQGLTIGTGGGSSSALVLNNDVFGYQALQANQTGSQNLAQGNYALTANTTGSSNTALGISSSIANTTGSSNTSAGFRSFLSNTIGSNNVAIGYQALQSGTNNNVNVAIGFNAMINGGQNAVAIGALAMPNGAGDGIAVGYNALGSQTTGADNNALGYSALSFVTTTNSNIGIGTYAGRWVGNGTVTNNITPSQSIYIGERAEPLADAQTNQIVIGYHANGYGSNKTTIGNTSTTGTVIFGTLTPGSFAAGVSGDSVAVSHAGVLGKVTSAIFPITQATADLTAQSAAGNVTTFTVGASTATFNISTYINVTAVSVDVIQGQITYTDENNTAQTVSLANISAIGNSAYSPITIRAKNATVITVKTNLTTGAGSITFDTGARITQL